MPIAQPGLKRKPNRGSTLRVRSDEHARWIRKQRCAACGKPAGYGDPIEAAHVRVGMVAGMGQKPDDWRMLPQHKTCHRESHVRGELRWWREHGVDDPVALALSYARRSPDQAVKDAAG